MVAPLIKFPDLRGFKPLVDFLEQTAPNGRFLYDGRYDGIFSFYVRAGDPAFQRGVVLGDKLIYSMRFYAATAIDNANSPSEVVNLLRTRCGCRWLAIERSGASDWIPAARHLRQAVKGPEFAHVRSFPIAAPESTWVDVYKFLPDLTGPENGQLRFSDLDSADEFRANPITR
jgi:hypothetical protein